MFKIIYEDDSLLAVDKPAGMLVTPANREKKASLQELLNKRLKEEGKSYIIHPCHRIDKDTSGIVLFAKGKKNQELIMLQFELRQVKKTYIAFVRGDVPDRSAPLVSHIKAIGKSIKKKAVLSYVCLAKRKSWSVVSIQPLTGRMHQIRLQFAQIGHPILGERLYAFGRDFKVNFRRLALHALAISLRHPATGKNITLHSDLAPDMKRFLDSCGLGSLANSNHDQL